jgi:hypothetical protein
MGVPRIDAGDALLYYDAVHDENSCRLHGDHDIRIHFHRREPHDR